MRNKPLLTLLSTATFSALAALSVPATLVAAPAAPAAKAVAKDKTTNNAWIVQLAEKPVSAYAGGIKGLQATKPRRGQKIDPNSPAVINYMSFLESRQNEVLAKVGGGKKLHSYGFVFNGFAAELTAEQAAKLKQTPGVLAVTKDELMPMATSTTPRFLGLDAPGGTWSVLSGNADGNPIIAAGPNSAGAGEGVVVGIIDSGIWPENPSFSDRDASGKRVFRQIPGWNGKCVPGEQFNASHCNQKLIAARWFGEGFGGAAGIKAEFPYEFVSARAADGHGVHTASTAAGNYAVAASAEGIPLGNISGMAPRARIAVYKSCWGFGGEGGCFNSDNVAAIDQAVADGVDVINYSISGTRTNFRDPVEIAFLFAADAGVFVAASAGNSGPGATTVAHPSPWITTVAASTHDRFYEGTATLGNGTSYTGASLTSAVGPAPLVYSGNVGLAGANPTEVQLCYPGTLDSAQVTGKIVVCDRDVIARTDKSLAVKQAGGIGMILVNRIAGSLNADLHYVPTVHLQNTVRAEVIAYAQAPGATASLSAGVLASVTAPTMASFSSRGPLLAGGGDLLKPDITAPGVDVLAAYSPVAAGRDFDFLSGTSMSSPHVAGLAALLKDRYPGWSPMAIKSALMTTAYQTTRTGTTGQVFGVPFDFGAGHAEPNRALDPGLVFDSSYNDWLGFLCGTQLPTSFCTGAGIPVLDPSDLNVPSIAIGDLPGSQAVKRTVTNVSGQTLTFTAATSGLPGITVTVSPASFTLAPGQKQTLTVSFTNNGAALNAYQNGAITWSSDQGHSVRIPTVIRPVALGAPAAVSSTGVAVSYSVRFGFTGSFSATPRGLVAPVLNPGTVAQDPDQTFNPTDPTGTAVIPVVIPAGTTYARFALFDADVTPGSDIDLYIYQGATLVGSSATGTSAEEINFSFANPTGGPIALTAYVHGWGVPAGSTPFVLHQWSIPATNAGNMTIAAPASATLGGTGTITVTPDPSLPAGRWLGSVVYGGAAGLPAPTIVSVTK